MKKRILVSQNGKEELDWLVRLLRTDYEVVSAEDGLNAWEIFEGSGDYFDLVIIDLILPRLSGLELLRKIREVDERTPVSIVTGGCPLETLEKALNLQIIGYLEWPFEPNDLFERVNWALGGTILPSPQKPPTIH